MLGLIACGENALPIKNDKAEQPEVPTNFAAQASPGKVSLSWDALPDTSYNIYWSTQNKFSINSSEGVIEDVKPVYEHNNQYPTLDYFYTIVAIKDGQQSFASKIIATTSTNTPVLAAPDNIQVNADDQTNRLTWNAVPGAINYLVYWTDKENQNPEDSEKPVMLLNKTELNHQYLKNDVTIYYRLRAKSDDVESLLSEKVQGTPRAIILKKPNNLRIKSMGETSVVVEWDGVESANSYKVYWSDTQPDFVLETANSSRLEPTEKEFILKDLEKNKIYYLVVVAQNEEDLEGPASYVLQIPFAISPGMPTDPVPVDPPGQQPVLLPPNNISVEIQGTSAIITWNTDNDAASYQLFFAKEPGVKKDNFLMLESGFASEKVTGLSYTADDLDMAATYYFSIISIIDEQQSTESIEQQFQTIIPDALYQAADVEKGASLYDQWWQGSINAPKNDAPLWAIVAKNAEGVPFNSAKNENTWRCVECHGWDYKGEAGLYGLGSLHYTGFIGVDQAAENKSREAIYDFIKNGANADGIAHSFSELSPQDTLDLTRFIKEFATTSGGFWQGSAEAGATLYNQDNASGESCNDSSCHSDDRSENFGKIHLLNFALSEPGRFTHYVRFGVGRMPGGPSFTDANDILAYLWQESRTIDNSNFSLENYDNAEIPEDEQWALGGRLYDRWILSRTTEKAPLPTGNHPLWPSEDTVVNGADTWRCKECHGWDYLGKAGAYGSGVHFTGIDGILSDTAKYNTAKEIYDFIRGSGFHAMETYLSDDDIYALTRFIATIRDEAQNDNAPFHWIGAQSGEPLIFDLQAGRKQYRTTSSNGGCRSCHNQTGSTWFFNDIDPERGELQNVSTLSRENPWEFLHKIRFGQPGSTMPGLVENRKDELKALSVAVDVLAYAQTDLAPDIKRGGRLYDNWWKENQSIEPTQLHMLAPLDSSLSIVDSWRCVSCHGWDYQGSLGINGLTVIGVDVLDFIRSGMVNNTADHAFESVLKISDLADLNAFILDPELNGVRDDIQSLLAAGDATLGQLVYESTTPGNCINCHGNNGTSIANVDLRFIAENNPALIMHKSRFGSAGSIMLPGLNRFTGLPAGDAANVTVFSATLVSNSEVGINVASLDRGGRLFDNWMREKQASDSTVMAPTMLNPLWEMRSQLIPDVQSVAESWRCVTCHQWNYKGIDLLQNEPEADNLNLKLALRREFYPSEEEFSTYLYEWIKSGAAGNHNYGSVDSNLPSPLNDRDIRDLVMFLQQGVIDTARYIFNINGKPITADPQLGKQIYQGKTLSEINCESCHGPDGESIPPGATNAIDIFSLANENPWKFLHKVRFSSPGTSMPSLIGIPGNQTEHAINLLDYAQQSFALRQ